MQLQLRLRKLYHQIPRHFIIFTIHLKLRFLRLTLHDIECVDNATLGAWVDAGIAPQQGGRRLQSQADLVAQSSGWWNSDRNVRTACTIVSVVRDSDGAPCPGATSVAIGWE